MTTLTRQQIDAAIETLQSTFSYDPPERWRSAYETLRPLRVELREARRAFAWVHFVDLASAFGTAAAFFYSVAVTQDDAFLFYLAAMLFVPAAIGMAADFLAQRRTPLLKLQTKIEGVCRQFDTITGSPAETSHVAS